MRIALLLALLGFGGALLPSAQADVASLTCSTNAPAAIPAGPPPAVAAPTNPPAAVSAAERVPTNAELSALLLRLPALPTNSISQIREQMRAGGPEVVGKFNELVGGLLTGKLTVEDIRREARAVAAQARELKRELGPDAGGSLDRYLSILERFLAEHPGGSRTNAPAQRTPAGISGPMSPPRTN